MIRGFRVENLRSINDSKMILLKRINILVGRNSSGKSTILRFLPLLRQSVEQATKGPILWYGRLVDFGTFENAARDNDASRGISLEFLVSISRRSTTLRRTLQGTRLDQNDFFWAKLGLNAKVRITLGRSAKDRVGNVRNLNIGIGRDSVDVTFGDFGIERVNVMSRDINLGPGKSWGIFSGKLIPSISLMQDMYIEDEDGDRHEFTDVASRPFFTEIKSALQKIAHGRTSEERIASIANRLKYASSTDFFQNFLEIPGISKDLESRLHTLGPNATELTNLRRYLLVSKLSELIKAVDEELATFATSVRYVEPLRAIAERYYRQQDLAVDEVDSRGENTAMFLESLAVWEIQNLKNWMKQNLGFWVVVEPGVGHVQVKIADENHPPRNIADLGFGYSQMLPIILQLWKNASGFKSPASRRILLAMEQPELHLHPDFQAKLADVISTCSTAQPASQLRVMIETHSDHLINRFGSLISEGKLDPRFIQVLVVSEQDDGASDVSVVEFSPDGTLGENWPLGFFTPEDA